ncbi:hypothetical protein SAMN05216297_106294 [Flavobacterium phragmitis]|uniref:DUF456 domain-containing protein n=2 Tax=Flavobacterium phragmitis TaxID=739143 RepID=A0A1I1R766_9FLAO|nr:hypothetical protein SAMN05216297_106294 [Flavobacterium phragmitis]
MLIYKNIMDSLLILLGFICMIVGVFGSFLPVLPGLSSCWVGLLLLYLTKAVENNYWVLGITFVLMVIITILDYVIPAKGTKKFGGSSYGVWGTNIGLIIGILAPIPFGVVIGPFVGALIGELLYDSQNHKRALKAATGSVLGFLASSFVNFLFSIIYLGIFLTVLWQNRALIF